MLIIFFKFNNSISVWFKITSARSYYNFRSTFHINEIFTIVSFNYSGHSFSIRVEFETV